MEQVGEELASRREQELVELLVRSSEEVTRLLRRPESELWSLVTSSHWELEQHAGAEDGLLGEAGGRLDLALQMVGMTAQDKAAYVAFAAFAASEKAN